ncbi:MAG: hypothetical protein MZW92_76650 [Comamonadaceae bacterium]|nr:hypothetical protein [Comamonadaceae bacterium]
MMRLDVRPDQAQPDAARPDPGQGDACSCRSSSRVMFLFFPAGLVLYWVVNNVLSIAQQWQITRDDRSRWQGGATTPGLSA